MDWGLAVSPSAVFLLYSRRLPPSTIHQAESEREIWFHPGVKEPSHHTR